MPHQTRGTLLRAIALIRTTSLLLTVVGGAGLLKLARTQTPEIDGAAINDRDALRNAVVEEEKRGAALTYSQSYSSSHKPVFLRGTLYSTIASFTAQKCELKIGTTIIDRYSGQVDGREIDSTQSSYQSTAEFVLTPEIAGAVQLLEARPGQLERGTRPVCAERQTCTIEWLKVGAKQPLMRVTRTTNDIAGYNGFVKDFDGMTDRFWIPVSSERAGDELKALLAKFAATCSQ
jgi:hypothetical protein